MNKELTPTQWIGVVIVALVFLYGIFLFMYVLYDDARTYLEFLPYVTQWQFFKLIVLLATFRVVVFPPIKD